jgi:antagonist of KipI
VIRDAGDSALLLELDPVIAPDVNARAIAVAAALRRAALPGVRDIVSAFRSVALFFDPMSADVAALAYAIRSAVDEPAVVEERSPIAVDVVYGGEHGPDLDDVAAFGGCTAAEVIERHAASVYRVYMLGFLPGFAYMGPVDESIAAPRRDTPRLRVPAGSVGIAGGQTGVYPIDSPGGWQIIGRTAMKVFDADRTPPALFAPGDSVRFVPIPPDVVSGFSRTDDVGAGFSRTDATVRLKADTTRGPQGSGPAGDRWVTVLRPGLLSTIQDAGRWGWQHIGVPVSGPMDPFSHRLANALVGNPPDAATIEATLAGPELRIEHDTTAAVTGGDFDVTLDDTSVPRDAALSCRAGSVLRLGERRSGARAYIGFAGGIATPAVLGSRSTHVLSALGGIDGRALRAGDRLPVGDQRQASRLRRARPPMSASGIPTGLPRRSAEGAKAGTEAGGARLRVLRGPQDHAFAEGALAALQGTRFIVSPQSDRMGYRLSADRPVPAPAGQMISDVTFTGGVQVPPSGQPILLMADRQTTGGYPQIATVITADLPVAGQLAPGDWVEFEVCSRDEAVVALIEQERHMLGVG